MRREHLDEVGISTVRPGLPTNRRLCANSLSQEIHRSAALQTLVFLRFADLVTDAVGRTCDSGVDALVAGEVGEIVVSVGWPRSRSFWFWLRGLWICSKLESEGRWDCSDFGSTRPSETPVKHVVYFDLCKEKMKRVSCDRSGERER